ncbi:MAG: AI-2E family transporter [Oscillospiraceae bacterium]|nr:AI-2E family transporter [Oscillospiraceae bacterium]
MKKTQREPIVLSQMRPVTLFLVLSGCIAFAFALHYISDVAGFIRKLLSALGPVFVGAVFAYLLAPAEAVVEKRVRKWFAKPLAKHPKLDHIPRSICSFLVVLLLVGSITVLVIATFSQVVDSLTRVIDQVPHYFDQVVAYFEKLLRADNSFARYLSELQKRFSLTSFGMGNADTAAISQKLLSMAASGATGTLGIVYNIVVGFIIAVYLLISRDRFIQQWKRILYAVSKPKTASWIDKQMVSANQTFGTAAVGKFIDSVLVGVLCYIGVKIIGTPYAALVAVVIGVTNMIPYFGPILGALPCALLILMEDPPKALYFLIFIFVLQQFDMNILDPKIVGKSIGLPAFWELFACLLGGGLFGVIGLVFGVPFFAVVYTLIRQFVHERLEERAKNGELTEEFLSEQLGITGPVQESGFFEDSNTPYIQHLILLEDIAQKPSDKPNMPEVPDSGTQQS